MSGKIKRNIVYNADSKNAWKEQYKIIKKFIEDNFDAKVNLQYDYKYTFTVNVFMQKDISTAIIKAVEKKFSVWMPEFDEIILDPHFHYKHHAIKIITITFAKTKNLKKS